MSGPSQSVGAGEVEVVVLDVGHGNTTIVRSEHTAVVDAHRNRAVVDELVRTGASGVQHLVLSHADNDHVGGAIKLLSHDTLAVEHLWLNPDSVKDTDTWGDLLAFACYLQREGQLGVTTAINAGTEDIHLSTDVRIEIIHPDIELAGHGPVTEGAAKSAGRAGEVTGVSSNGAAAVGRVVAFGRPLVLLPSDIDAWALARILKLGSDLSAEVLVFPHHGGLCDGDLQRFTEDLLAAVQPRAVFFSLGRHSQYENPQPDILPVIERVSPAAWVACTQLSRRCLPSMHKGRKVPAGSGLVNERPSAGRSGQGCCAGTIVVRASPSSVSFEPQVSEHQAFVETMAPNRLCAGLATDASQFG